MVLYVDLVSGNDSTGDGSAIAAGLNTYLVVPYDCTIKSWSLIGDAAGSAVVDIYKSTWANFPPVVGGTITGSEKPTLVTQQTNQLLTLTSWTTSISSGEVLYFTIDSAATITKLHLVIQVEKI